MLLIGCNIFSSGQKPPASVSASIAGLTGNPTYGATAQTGVQLSAVLSGDVAASWQWNANGAPIAGATSATFTPQIGVNVADLDVITVTINGTVTSGGYAVRYAPPVNTVAPVVSGSAGLGDVLSVSQGTWTGSNLSFAYQTHRDGVPIAGGITNTHTIVLADDNTAIDWEVTATNSGGSASADSNAVLVDDFELPVITSAPTLSGTEQVGSVLTASPGTRTGNPTPTRTWQWQRFSGSWVNISGATSATYTLQGADEGLTVRAVQIETNALGSDSLESAASGTIAAGPSIAPPVVSASSYDAATGQISISMNADAGDCTIDYTAHDAGGTQKASGSFVSSAPTDSDAITLTDTTISEIRFTATNAAGNTGTPSAPNNTIITGVVVYPSPAAVTFSEYPSASASPATKVVDMEPGLNLVPIYLSGQTPSSVTIGGNTMTPVDTGISVDGGQQHLYWYSYFHNGPKQTGVTIQVNWSGSAFRAAIGHVVAGNAAYVAGSRTVVTANQQVNDLSANANADDILLALNYIRQQTTPYIASTGGGALTVLHDALVESGRFWAISANFAMAAGTPVAADNDCGVADAHNHSSFAILLRPN